MKWFKENIHPIANQGNRPLADFEVSAILTELLSSGNVKFFDIDTFFRNNLAPGNQNVHTHQTTNWWSEGDQAINDGRSIPKAKVYPNRYLVNDSSVFRFRQQDFFNTEGAKARDFYQVLDYEKNDWVNQ